jgi:hypothetical protein
MLKEYDTDGTTEKYLGSTVKGPTGKYTGTAGTSGSASAVGDYIIPDVENQALVIQDVNNAYPIVSYGSNGGVRLMPVVGYQVAGQFSTKLYREHAPWWFDMALRKKSTTNKTADIPSIRLDRCFYDSDFTPGFIGDAFTGVKVSSLSLTVGSASPMVQMAMGLVGSRCSSIPATDNVPDYAKEPDCSSYPVFPYTFRHTKVYADFTGGSLISSKTTTWDLAGLTDAKQIKTIRSVNLNFRNQLATTTHEEGLIDRIQRTAVTLQFSIVVDLMDPQPSINNNTTATNYPQSTAWQFKYRQMRSSITGGNMSLVVLFDDGTQKIVIDLGKKALQDGYTTVTPLPDIFAAQISGSVTFDPDNCGVGLGGFDWTIQ